MPKPGVAHSRAEREGDQRKTLVKKGTVARVEPPVRASLLAFLVGRTADASRDEMRVMAEVMKNGIGRNEMQAVLVRRYLYLEELADDAETENEVIQYHRLIQRCLDTMQKLIEDESASDDVREIVFRVERAAQSPSDTIPVE